MLGAIAGDVIGSVYEHRRIKTTEFPLIVPEITFTDDTVMTVATAAALLGERDYAAAYQDFRNRHPRRGYGPAFQRWLRAWDMAPTAASATGPPCG